jgi:hypothetical protein
VIVDEHDRRRAHPNRGPKALPRVNQTSGHGAARHLGHREQSTAGVESQDPKALDRSPAPARAQAGRHIRRLKHRRTSVGNSGMLRPTPVQAKGRRQPPGPAIRQQARHPRWSLEQQALQTADPVEGLCAP